MSLVFLDIEFTENKIVIELGNYKKRQTEGYSFLPPKNSNQHPSLLGVQTSSWNQLEQRSRKIY